MTIVAPDYIKAMAKPNGNKPVGRKVWGIDLELVILPLLTAMNLNGDGVVPHAAIGAPLRLGYAQDGSVKFHKSGRPVIKVVKEVADFMKLSKESYIASLTDYTNEVKGDDPEGYKAQVEAQNKAGKPILERDTVNLKTAIEAIAEAEKVAEAEYQKLIKAEAEKVAKAEADRIAKAQNEKSKVTA